MKRKKRISYYEGKTLIEGQSCKKCVFACFTQNRKENYCKQTKRFGKPARGAWCKHYKGKYTISKINKKSNSTK